MSKNCPNCGSPMDYRLGQYECPGCGHTEEKNIAGPEVIQAKPSGPGFKQQQWGGASGQVPPPGTLHSPGSAPPPGLEARMSSLSSEGGGGGGGMSTAIDGEKKVYFIITVVLCSLGLLGSLGTCVAGDQATSGEAGITFFACLLQVGLTWWVLYSAPSCIKWTCIVLTGLGVLSSLLSLFTIPAALSQAGMNGGFMVFVVIIWLVGLAYNAWFVSILYRDVQGYDY